MGVLTLIHDALTVRAREGSSGGKRCARDLEKAAQPLADALGVAGIELIDGALRELKGRPPAAVMRSLTNPQLVEAICGGLDALGVPQLADEVAKWGPRNPANPMEALPLSADALTQRHELVSALRQRAGELLDGWRQAGAVLTADVLPIDGRTLATAARVWQVPMITGEIPPVPTAGSALHPNRLGRTAAIVTYSKLPVVLRSTTPDEVIFETLALLVAVAEAVSVPEATNEIGAILLMRRWSEKERKAARQGMLPLKVRVGEPVDPASADVNAWWSVFSAWGATTRKAANAIPVVWKLSEAEADVLVWALCSCAVRMGVAADMPEREPRRRRLGPPLMPVRWEDQWETNRAPWVEGSKSLWGLMQSMRRFGDRTEFPGQLSPTLDDDSSWPWRAR
jgi:hypothetical protein